MKELIPDARTCAWFMVPSPWPIWGLVIMYFVVIYKIVPDFMKNREAFELRRFIAFYNIFQIFSNAYVAYESVVSSIQGDTFHLYCEPPNYTDFPPAIRIIHVSYWFFWLKVIDLIETVIFILRKKQNQVSVLHVYHHSTTVLVTWLHLKYLAGGMFVWIMMINSVVHVIMYTYYYFSSYGPKVQRYLSPVKPMITIIQIVQLSVLLLLMIQGLFPSCDVPTSVCIMNIVNFGINIILFNAFYKKSYTKTKKN